MSFFKADFFCCFSLLPAVYVEAGLGHITFTRIPQTNIYQALQTFPSQLVSKHLYDLGKPFCSFLDTTMKRRLISTDQEILSRNPWGDVQAFFSFKLLPLDKMIRRVTYNMDPYVPPYYRFYVGFVRDLHGLIRNYEIPGSYYIQIQPRKVDPKEESSTKSKTYPLVSIPL